MRFELDGLWDNKQPLGGPITGSGPGYARACRLFAVRQAARKRLGKWRAGCNQRDRTNNGTYIDPDWRIV